MFRLRLQLVLKNVQFNVPNNIETFIESLTTKTFLFKLFNPLVLLELNHFFFCLFPTYYIISSSQLPFKELHFFFSSSVYAVHCELSSKMNVQKMFQ